MISFSCSKESNFEKTLRLSDTNRPELEKTINHYKHVDKDSLKLKAAIYLIENMHTKYSFKSNFYRQYVKYASSEVHADNERRIDSLVHIYQTDFNTRVYDHHVISSDYLIKNIDFAFKVWRKQPWGSKINFATFCEYVLPYRIGNEPLENWREKAYNDYINVLDTLNSESVVDAAKAINTAIFKQPFNFSNKQAQLPDLGFISISSNFMGYCKNSCDYTVYILRAIGIPSGEDFVSQWANRSGGHTWNFIIDENKKIWPFDGHYTNIGVKYVHRPYSKKGKVFRHSYKINDNHLAVSNIPEIFQNPNIKDFSSSYWVSPPIIVKYKDSDKIKKGPAVLCVFNNSTWVPVQLGVKVNEGFSFTDMESDVVYLPCIFKDDELTPFSYPLILQADGNVKTLQPIISNPQKVSLYRKYAINPLQSNAVRVLGGEFQGSNSSNFRPYKTIAVIDKIPENELYGEVKSTSHTPFKYIRYQAPDQSYGNMAEIKFYYKTKQLKGQVINIDGKNNLLRYPPENAFDGDNLTYYVGVKDSSWVGLEFDKSVQVSSIEFAPRNDDNFIKPGDMYELFFHDKKSWISLGRRKANQSILTYDNVPKNALLWLHNNSGGTEERIFTYDSKANWW